MKGYIFLISSVFGGLSSKPIAFAFSSSSSFESAGSIIPPPKGRQSIYNDPMFWRDVEEEILSGQSIASYIDNVGNNGSDPLRRFKRMCGLLQSGAELETSEAQLASGQEVRMDQWLPGLSAMPLHDSTQFPWLQQLEACTSTFREELLVLVTELDEEPELGDGLWSKNTHYNEDWSSLQLTEPWEHTHSPVGMLFPSTMDALDRAEVPYGARLLGFNKQSGKSGVCRHSDGCNFILRCHLGLSGPVSECGMLLGGSLLRWDVGKAFVFDSSFYHETFNNSDDPRFILNIDVWHPDVRDEEKKALKQWKRLSDRYDSKQADRPLHGGEA
mmetsp:Transcript_60938/g.83684  ORF Transcript_60938/g.83684 Transcript_60938/m.83684 type:complete len:329 (-) Transcript_60938:98-1084(-)|eukprot:CAMPEP_0185762488 /NCGR_PEP_ID=MMETSP1174-20130828/21452_1 /TAXON_ID=35687 /ORGANISM="Dictyocha speculum, Strain CCMP1381" /LENGTH=328 /DNA_ID=CAMNT_0028444185 /DNA_START=63 /DNA_END=1049 /DNA_ORIENTATION=-